jgi:hypothetical protein
MKTTHKQTALDIISKSNSIEVKFNIPLTDSYSNVHEILITRCNASIITELVNSGFSLFMTDKGLSIENFN